jgi:hypothetical protein
MCVRWRGGERSEGACVCARACSHGARGCGRVGACACSCVGARARAWGDGGGPGGEAASSPPTAGTRALRSLARGPIATHSLSAVRQGPLRRLPFAGGPWEGCRFPGTPGEAAVRQGGPGRLLFARGPWGGVRRAAGGSPGALATLYSCMLPLGFARAALWRTCALWRVRQKPRGPPAPG